MIPKKPPQIGDVLLVEDRGGHWNRATIVDISETEIFVVNDKAVESSFSILSDCYCSIYEKPPRRTIRTRVARQPNANQEACGRNVWRNKKDKQRLKEKPTEEEELRSAQLDATIAQRNKAKVEREQARRQEEIKSIARVFRNMKRRERRLKKKRLALAIQKASEKQRTQIQLARETRKLQRQMEVHAQKPINRVLRKNRAYGSCEVVLLSDQEHFVVVSNMISGERYTIKGPVCVKLSPIEMVIRGPEVAEKMEKKKVEPTAEEKHEGRKLLRTTEELYANGFISEEEYLKRKSEALILTGDADEMKRIEEEKEKERLMEQERLEKEKMEKEKEAEDSKKKASKKALRRKKSARKNRIKKKLEQIRQLQLEKYQNSDECEIAPRIPAFPNRVKEVEDSEGFQSDAISEVDNSETPKSEKVKAGNNSDIDDLVGEFMYSSME